MKTRIITAVVLLGLLLIPVASIKADGVPLPNPYCRPGSPCPK